MTPSRLVLKIILTISLLAASLAAHGQLAGKVYRIGILEAIPAARNAANLDALRDGLRDLGYVEGRNLGTGRRMVAPSGSRTSCPSWFVSRST